MSRTVHCAFVMDMMYLRGSRIVNSEQFIVRGYLVYADGGLFCRLRHLVSVCVRPGSTYVRVLNAVCIGYAILSLVNGRHYVSSTFRLGGCMQEQPWLLLF